MEVKEFDPEIDRCPKPDELWFYKETGNFYLVTKRLKMKAGNGEWMDAVVYERNDMEFCRDLQTFGEKFAFHRVNF